MKRIKNVLILLIIFILTGCSVKYTLTINKDLSVNEKVEATEYTNRMLAITGQDEKQSINYLKDMFGRDDTNINVSSRKEESETIATVTLSHDSLEDFVENFSSDIAPEATIEEDGDTVTLTIEQTKILTDYGSNSPLYDTVEVVIDVPFEVKYHNADSVQFHKYKWILEKEKANKSIIISFDKENVRDEQKISIGNITFSVKYQVIAIVIIGLVILTIVAIVYFKNKKNNKV